MVKKVKIRSRYDELDISVVAVLPEQEPVAVLQVVHGMCGCKERFMPFMEFMAQNGIACVAGDHRGHGESLKSIDDLGYFYDGGYKALVDDMRLVTEWIRAEIPGKPVYLLGHSMGSMAARVYIKEDDSFLSGLVLCGSPSKEPMSRIGLALVNFMCLVGLSRYRMKLSQKMTSNKYNRRFASEGYQVWTCSNPQSRQALKENPRCNFIMTANGSKGVLGLMKATYSKSGWKVSNPHLPILFLSGSDDPVMLSVNRFRKAVKHLSDRGYMDVTSVLYPGMRHEVLNEIDKEEVWKDILDFIKV